MGTRSTAEKWKLVGRTEKGQRTFNKTPMSFSGPLRINELIKIRRGEIWRESFNFKVAVVRARALNKFHR